MQKGLQKQPHHIFTSHIDHIKLAQPTPSHYSRFPLQTQSDSLVLFISVIIEAKIILSCNFAENCGHFPDGIHSVLSLLLAPTVLKSRKSGFFLLQSILFYPKLFEIFEDIKYIFYIQESKCRSFISMFNAATRESKCD